MGELKDMLLKTYLKKGARPPEAPKPKADEPELSAKAPPKPIPVERPKSIGNIAIAMQAQKIYNPNLPPAPPMKSPSKAMLDQGTAPAMNMNGPWGKPDA